MVFGKIFKKVKRAITNTIPKGLSKAFGAILRPIMPLITGAIKIITAIVTLLPYLLDPTKWVEVVIPLIVYIIVLISMLIFKIDLWGISLGGLIIGIMCWAIHIARGAFILSKTIVLEIWRRVFILIVYIVSIPLPGIGRFLYSWFIATENHPKAWFQLDQWHHGNKFSRSFPTWIIKRPCAHGSYPTSIPWLCNNSAGFIPNKCPTSMIREEFGKKNSSSSHIQPSKYANHMKNYNEEINTYYETCDKAYTPFKNITRSICRCVVSMNRSRNGYAYNTSKLLNMCYQERCRHGKLSPLCAHFEPHRMKVSPDIAKTAAYLLTGKRNKTLNKMAIGSIIGIGVCIAVLATIGVYEKYGLASKLQAFNE